jgi:hypothetical protein
MTPVLVGLLARNDTTSHCKTVESKSHLSDVINHYSRDFLFFVNVKSDQVCDIPRLRQSELDFYLGALFMAL